MQKIEIPFDRRDGRLYRYVGAWYTSEVVEWRPNVVFESTIRYAGYARGRSSVIIQFHHVDGEILTHMSLMDFDRIVGRMELGFYTGKFHYKKVGDSYFMTPVLDQKDG